MFNVAIIGGENTGDYPYFKKKCIACLKNKVKETGVMIYTIGDKYVEAFAERYGIATHFFPANFNLYGSEALKLRAQSMLRDCNGIIAFGEGIKDIDMIVKMAEEKDIQIRRFK